MPPPFPPMLLFHLRICNVVLFITWCLNSHRMILIEQDTDMSFHLPTSVLYLLVTFSDFGDETFYLSFLDMNGMH